MQELALTLTKAIRAGEEQPRSAGNIAAVRALLQQNPQDVIAIPLQYHPHALTG